jgi:hypothetical protein
LSVVMSPFTWADSMTGPEKTSLPSSTEPAERELPSCERGGRGVEGWLANGCVPG